MNKDQQLIFEGLHFNSIRYKMVTNWRREQGFFYALRVLHRNNNAFYEIHAFTEKDLCLFYYVFYKKMYR